MAMLSVAGTRRRKKSGAIIASPGEKSGLLTCTDMRILHSQAGSASLQLFTNQVENNE